MSATQTNPRYMAGTEGTGKYLVTHVTNLGRFGHRDLGNGKTRLRVEPTKEGLPLFAQHLTRTDGWKLPGDSGQNRFSKVVSSDDRDDYEAVVKLFTPKSSRSRRMIVIGLSVTATAAAVIYWLSH